MQSKPLSGRHYPNAPITEAIIAIGFQLPTGLVLKDLLRVQEEIKNTYPLRGEWRALQVELDPNVGTKPTDPQTIGYQFISSDGKRIVRLALEEFAFSQLAPYDRWETLYSEARRIWMVVDKILHPLQINRVAVRFINRIDMPSPDPRGIDLDIYFHAAPKVPAELPQILSTYFVRLEIPFDSPPGVLVLTLATAPSPQTALVSALLDLDAIIRNVDIDATEAWEAIEQLRDIKNAAFESSITDSARELFQ